MQKYGKSSAQPAAAEDRKPRTESGSGERITVSIRFRTILLFFITGWYACAGAAQLPRPIGIVTNGHKIPSAAYSLYVREVGKQEPVLAVNAELPLNPASVIKIIPTLAALELLGPGYRWKTEVYTLGSIRDGVLQGDILFKGYGDPSSGHGRIPQDTGRTQTARAQGNYRRSFNRSLLL